MEAFYTYVYANLIALVIVAIGISVLSVIVGRNGKYRLSRQLALVGIATDAILAGIYMTSFVFVQHSNDLFMALLWGGLGYWNYRRYKGR